MAAFAIGVVFLFVDLSSSLIRIAPLEIVPIVLIALITNERVALYAALAFTVLTILLSHLGGRSIGSAAIVNGAILAISYAVTLLIVTAARQLAKQMTILNQEASDAKRVHDALFPTPLEYDKSWRIDVVHLPLRGVGGDFYYVGCRPGGTMLFVADVSGKGIVAAMLLAALKTLCDATTGRTIDPKAELAIDNRALHRTSTDDMFATAWLAVLDAGGRVRCASAGHERPLLRRRNDVWELPGGGIPLGVDDGAEPAEFTIGLEPGDAVICYSDGLSDLLERDELTIDDLFEHFDELPERLPLMNRRDDVLALRFVYRGPRREPAGRSIRNG